MVPADGFQQVEGAPGQAEFSEHDQAGRAGASRHLGMAGGPGKLCWMAVGGELFDERPSEVRIGLDDENRLAARAHRWTPLGPARRGPADRGAW